MSKTQIQIRLEGRSVEEGAIELRRLSRLGEQFQKAVDRMAYAIEKQSGSRRSQNDLRKETRLTFEGSSEGSFVAHIGLARPQLLIEDYYDIASEAVKKLIAGIDVLNTSEDSEMPDGYDQGVLAVLKDFGTLLNHGIDSIDFRVSDGNQEITSVYDSVSQALVVARISEPEQKIAAAEGNLLMANFGRDKNQCHLYDDDDNYLRCSFDEDTLELINTSIRQRVYVIGVATIDPISDEISHLHIKELHLLDGQKTRSDLYEALQSYIADNDTITSFQRGWEQALSGDISPIETLWDGIDAE